MSDGFNINLEGRERRGKPNRGQVLDCKVFRAVNLFSAGGTIGIESLLAAASDPADRISPGSKVPNCAHLNIH